MSRGVFKSHPLIIASNAYDYKPLPSLDCDTLPPLPQDWLKQFRQFYHEHFTYYRAIAIVEAIEGHIDSTNNYKFRRQLIESLQQVYRYIQGHFRPITEDEKHQIFCKLREDITACTEGFHCRINAILEGVMYPVNLTQALTRVRSDLVKKVANRYTDKVHTYNSMEKLAATMGLGICPTNKWDPYRGDLIEEDVCESLQAVFLREFTPFNLPFLLEEQFRSICSVMGTAGEYGYPSELVTRIGKFFDTIFFDGVLSQLAYEERPWKYYFIMGTTSYGDAYYEAINWAFIRYRCYGALKAKSIVTEMNLERAFKKAKMSMDDLLLYSKLCSDYDLHGLELLLYALRLHYVEKPNIVEFMKSYVRFERENENPFAVKAIGLFKNALNSGLRAYTLNLVNDYCEAIFNLIKRYGVNPPADSGIFLRNYLRFLTKFVISNPGAHQINALNAILLQFKERFTHQVFAAGSFKGNLRLLIEVMFCYIEFLDGHDIDRFFFEPINKPISVNIAHFMIRRMPAHTIIFSASLECGLDLFLTVWKKLLEKKPSQLLNHMSVWLCNPDNGFRILQMIIANPTLLPEDSLMDEVLDRGINTFMCRADASAIESFLAKIKALYFVSNPRRFKEVLTSSLNCIMKYIDSIVFDPVAKRYDISGYQKLQVVLNFIAQNQAELESRFITQIIISACDIFPIPLHFKYSSIMVTSFIDFLDTCHHKINVDDRKKIVTLLVPYMEFTKPIALFQYFLNHQYDLAEVRNTVIDLKLRLFCSDYLLRERTHPDLHQFICKVLVTQDWYTSSGLSRDHCARLSDVFFRLLSDQTVSLEDKEAVIWNNYRLLLNNIGSAASFNLSKDVVESLLKAYIRSQYSLFSSLFYPKRIMDAAKDLLILCSQYSITDDDLAHYQEQHAAAIAGSTKLVHMIRLIPVQASRRNVTPTLCETSV